MSKICSKCGIKKEDSEFRKDNKSKDKLSYWCKECDKEYKRIYYKLNKDKIRKYYNDKYKNDPDYRQKQNEINKLSYHNHKEIREVRRKGYINDLQDFVDSLKTPCVKCGEFRPWLIQFHHIDPTEKEFQIQATHGKDRLEEESKKCICLCSNCHTEYHFFFGKKPSEPKESLKKYISEDFNYDSVAT